MVNKLYLFGFLVVLVAFALLWFVKHSCDYFYYKNKYLKKEMKPPFSSNTYRYNYKNLRRKIEEKENAYIGEHPDASSIPRPDIEEEYLMYSYFIISMFIKEETPVIYTGTYRDVNWRMIEIIERMIRQHPFIWRTFFMY